MKEAGGNTIYIEHLQSYNAEDLAEFNRTGQIVPGSSLDAALYARSDLKELMKEANRLGMTVGFMDNRNHTRWTGARDGMENRAMLMNHEAVKNIRANPPQGDGKFIVIAGGAHARSHAGMLENGIPGLDQLLGVPAVYVESVQPPKPESGAPPAADGKIKVTLSMDIQSNRIKDATKHVGRA